MLAEFLRPSCVEVLAKMLWQGNAKHADIPLRLVNTTEVKAELSSRVPGSQVAVSRYGDGFLYGNTGLNDLGTIVLKLLS